MTLNPGQRLGAYEVVSAIGAGGMGEVFRARDTKLNRDVALKILPAAFAADPDRLARFMREAQTLASLNHPHIAQIHGFEDSGGTHALVMELVEGEDLSARIGRGPIPPADALDLAKQIAEALEAAHDLGIVHRDLKPANIKVRPDGAVKVLDFGLAKAMDPLTASGANPSLSPTLTVQGTFAGMILGTAAYMAPEQARGASVDKRADIWAFGVVVFEMLTGKRLFEGDTVSDTLASVLRQEIDWSRLPASTPAAARELLRRCLERDGKRRLRDIGEARIALERAQASPAPAAANTSPPVRTNRGPGSIAWLTLAMAIAAVASGIAIWPRLRPATELAPVRLTTLLPRDVGIDPNTYNVLAISHDGSTVAFAGFSNGASRIYVRRLGEYESRALPGTEGASSPFFSPDGAWIGFFVEGRLTKTPTAGGPVINLAPATGARDNRGGVWAADDTILFVADATNPIAAVPASGGTSRSVSSLDAAKHERTHRWPALMPDQKTVLFNVGSIAHPDDYDDATIEAVNLDTGDRRIVVSGGRRPQYVAATGDLLYVRGKILYAVALDAKTLQTTGKPRPIVDNVMGDPSTGAAFFGVARNGTLAYIPGDPTGSLRRMAWTDAAGKVTPIDLPPALYMEPRVSPDGSRIAYATVDSSNSNVEILVADAATGAARQIKSAGRNRTPVWSRDSRRLFYVSYDPGKNLSTVEVRAADGSGQAQAIGVFDGPLFISDLAPDGTVLYLSGVHAGGGGQVRLYRLPSAGAPDSKPVAAVSDAQGAGAVVSPDGRWLAYLSDESRRGEIVVQSATGGGRTHLSDENGGMNPHWGPGGKTVYYVTGRDIVGVPFDPSTGLATGRPRRALGDQLTLQFDSQEYYDVAPDGRFLVMRASDDAPATPEIRLILNWFTDLRAAK